MVTRAMGRRDARGTALSVRAPARWIRSGRVRTLAAAALSLCGIAATDAIEAQTRLCLPEAYGVPALSGGPRWWDVNNNGSIDLPTEDNRLTDPRWAGATAIGDNNSYKAFFRANREGSSAINLSWEYADDPTIETAADGVYLGFISPAPNTDTIVVVVLMNTATVSPPTMGTTQYTASVLKRSGGVWTVPPAQPGWIANFTRVWAQAGAPNYATGTAMGNLTWAIQMHIPTSTNTARSYMDSVVVGPGAKFFWVLSEQITSNSPFNQISWPRGLTVGKSGSQYTFPAFGQWGELSLASTCTGGISLTYGNVATTNLPYWSNIVFDAVTAGNAAAYNNTRVNTFYVRPTNNMTTDIGAHTLKTRVRVANWGIQPDWNDIPRPDLVWTDIPNSLTADNQGVILAGTTANAANDIRFTWVVDNCQVFDMVSPGAPWAYPAICTTGANAQYRWPKLAHRCIYAEIFSSQPYDFANYSIYENMDFVPLSTYGRNLEVTTAGMRQLRGSKTIPVYLLVTATNMPRKVDMEDRLFAYTNRERLTFLQRAATGGLPFDARQMEKWAPTYRIRGFYGTSDSTDEGGRGRFPIVKPGTSITYYPIHAGAMTGFTTDLRSVELTAPNMLPVKQPAMRATAPNLLRVDLVPDSRLTLSTTLRAVEPGDTTQTDTTRKDTTTTPGPNPPPPNCPFQRMNLGIVGGLGVLGLMTSRRRRRDDEPLDSDPPETSR